MKQHIMFQVERYLQDDGRENIKITQALDRDSESLGLIPDLVYQGTRNLVFDNIFCWDKSQMCYPSSISNI